MQDFGQENIQSSRANRSASEGKLWKQERPERDPTGHQHKTESGYRDSKTNDRDSSGSRFSLMLRQDHPPNCQFVHATIGTHGNNSHVQILHSPRARSERENRLWGLKRNKPPRTICMSAIGTPTRSPSRIHGWTRSMGNRKRASIGNLARTRIHVRTPMRDITGESGVRGMPIRG